MNDGLTMPGRCESCGEKGPRFHFRNVYAEPEFTLTFARIVCGRPSCVWRFSFGRQRERRP